MSITDRPWRTALALLALVAALAALPAAPVDGQEAGSLGGQEAGPDGEIIGGGPADPGEYPYQVALLRRSVANRFQAQFCGGSLISPDTVLTAAHCVDDARASEVDVLVGTHTLAQGGGGSRVPVRTIRVHGGYQARTYLNDIAILQLGTELPDELVRTIQPGEETLWTPGTLATVTGWGDTIAATNQVSYPLVLREVDTPILSDAQCRARYGSTYRAGRMVCAGDVVNGGEDSCQGDSGGPLVVWDGPDPVQVGVVSFGIGCGRARYPGVYTRLAAFTDFVNPYLDPDSAPAQVRNLTKRRLDGSTVRLAWSPPAFDGGTAITGYVLRIPSLSRERVLGPGQRSVNVGGLPGGATSIQVVAVNAIGEGAPRTTTVNL